jgi:CheY-like chemotaxis protein
MVSIMSVDNEEKHKHYSELSILVADDDNTNILLLESYLKQGNHHVTVSNNGDEVLKAISETKGVFDILLLDRMMPGKGGIELIEEIRKDSRYSKTPIIIQTAAAGKMQIEEGIQSCASYYLTKPFSYKDLTIAINAVMT